MRLMTRRSSRSSREALARRGIIAFMASRDVKGGDLWEPSIREAIVACSEMLVVITPNSKDRPWIMIEVGAGCGFREKYHSVFGFCGCQRSSGGSFQIPSAVYY